MQLSLLNVKACRDLGQDIVFTYFVLFDLMKQSKLSTSVTNGVAAPSISSKSSYDVMKSATEKLGHSFAILNKVSLNFMFFRLR